MYERLKKICAEKGLTVSKLCEIVTGSSGNLATWKKDYMRSDYLSAVADALGCSTDYLLERVDAPNEVYSIDGDNNVQVNGNHSPTTVIKTDKTSEEFMQIFANLPLMDRIEIMSFTMEKVKNI